MDVRLPNLGEGADSGTVVNLLVKEGDEIKKGQTLLELENEKAVAPIPSPADGRVGSVRVKVGDKISVGQVILSLADGKTGGAPAPAAAPPARKGAKEAEPEEAPEEEPRAEEPAGAEPESADEPESRPSLFPPPASPTLRILARDLGLDLNRIKGSERGGRIVMADLRAYIQRLQRLAFAAKPGKPGKPAKEQIDFSKWGAILKRPLTPLRRTIAERMTENWNTIPHVTQFHEADITRVLELRKKHAAAYEKAGTRLTLTTFALKAAVEALKKHAIFNSSLDETNDELVFKEYFHIGLAVDTDAGLIVPVIRDVDKKNGLELSRDVNDLAEKARQRKISLEELKGGSFTISNQGGIGGAHFTPIVNKPEVAILGLGRGMAKPVVKEGAVVIRTLLPLALSYDHRVIDGGQAARFIEDLAAAFENFPEEGIRI